VTPDSFSGPSTLSHPGSGASAPDGCTKFGTDRRHRRRVKVAVTVGRAPFGRPARMTIPPSGLPLRRDQTSLQHLHLLAV
jgi:hypothetical protein